MRLSTVVLTASTLLVPEVIAATLPICSTNSRLPCQCPKDTAYDQAVTITVIGAAASDVTALISDCKFHDIYALQCHAFLIIMRRLRAQVARFRSLSNEGPEQQIWLSAYLERPYRLWYL